MYNHIIGVYDELWDIIEDGVGFNIDFEGMVVNRKSLIVAQRNIYKKHHIIRGILVEYLPHSEYIQIVEKSTSKAIFESPCSTYKGTQQVKEAKANQLVH